jgi:hypothetical protein
MSRDASSWCSVEPRVTVAMGCFKRNKEGKPVFSLKSLLRGHTKFLKTRWVTLLRYSLSAFLFSYWYTLSFLSLIPHWIGILSGIPLALPGKKSYLGFESIYYFLYFHRLSSCKNQLIIRCHFDWHFLYGTLKMLLRRCVLVTLQTVHVSLWSLTDIKSVSRCKFEDYCLLGCCAVCRLVDRPDDGGNKHLWNVCKLLPDYTAQHPRRQSSS